MFGFLAAAPEDRRVAPFQPDDVVTGASLPYHSGVDFRL